MSNLSKSLRTEVQRALGAGSVWARAEAYIQIDPDGRRGARRVRMYQEMFSGELAAREQRVSGRADRRERVRVAAARRNWVPRSRRWTHEQRVVRRAAAHGLDRLAVQVARAYQLYSLVEGRESLRRAGLAVRLRSGEVVHGDTLADIGTELAARAEVSS